MRKILFVFICCSCWAFGQLAELPRYEFSSTSSYCLTEVTYSHTIPVSDIQQPFSVSTEHYNPIRRSPGYDPADPRWTPVGDAVTPLIIMSFLYFLFQAIKNRHTISMLK